MDEMTITSAQYVTNIDGSNMAVKATINKKEMFVSIDPANRHYAEILKQVASGELTIADAD
jgi:hypothetical protein